MLDNLFMQQEKDTIIVTFPDSTEKSACVYRVFINDFDDIKSRIDKYIKDLMFGDNNREYLAARYAIKSLMNGKSREQKLGIVSELLMHLFLATIDMERFNLIRSAEERSMKKGFDGVYVLNNELWFGESKSSEIADRKHSSNIQEALHCFRQKVVGPEEVGTNNNPWENALSHIKLVQDARKMDESIKKQIELLSFDYDRGIYTCTKNYNIIPSSTLIINDGQTFEQICNECKDIVSSFEYKKLIILCINNQLFLDIVNYLEMRNE